MVGGSTKMGLSPWRADWELGIRVNLTYFKRFRMEIALAGRDWLPAPVPPGYRFLSWSPALLDAFAEAKAASFNGEIDANVFPCLSDLAGCRRLMTEIVRKPGFLPQATWLLAYASSAAERPEYCGTVQGVRDPASGLGAIQNLGIAPQHRNQGLGTALLFHALHGFQQAGLARCYLEVTAQNRGAIRVYERIGFATTKTIFKAVEPVHS
jgi:ribosomal protein S18 acetylase RimI-like enzyme